MDSSVVNNIPDTLHKKSQHNPNLLVVDYLGLLKYTQDCQLAKQEIDTLLKLFKKQDVNKTGQLPFHDILELLKEYGFQITHDCKEKIFKEIENKNTTKLDFQCLLYIVRVIKDYNQVASADEEVIKYMDAYVALGGQVDGSGSVNKTTLLNILKFEFELMFEIDEWLEKLDIQQDEMDFQQFCILFQPDNPRGMSRASSILSLLSQRSSNSGRSVKSISTVKVRMRDFERYWQKIKQQELEMNNSISSPIKK